MPIDLKTLLGEVLNPPQPQPQPADRVRWAHTLFANALPPLAIFPAHGTIDVLRSPERIQGIWEALSWVGGCPSKELDVFLEFLAERSGISYQAKTEPAATAPTNGTAKSDPPADDLRAKGYARSRQEVRETIELMEKQIAIIKKEVDREMPPAVRQSAESAIRTYETIAGTLLWAVDPSSELARQADGVITIARASFKLFEMLDRTREAAKAAGAA